MAIYECESCGNQEKKRGYDDAYFHQRVIPNMECVKCGNKAPDTYRGLAPKYDEWEVV